MDFSSQNIMQWSRLGMRKAYGVILNELANAHENIVSMAADVVDSANLIDFAKQHPDRHFNIGISEQNMVGMAAGMAKEGSNVFITSFAPFVSLRIYEAIRTVVSYMNLNVKIVALSSGFSLGVQGATHYALEDIAIMRAIPNLLVLSPADTTEMAKMLEHLATYNGPAYLRLTGLPGSASVYKTDYNYDPSNIDIIRKGEDVGIFAAGTLVNESIRAARLLKKQGISAAVINFSTLNPLNLESVAKKCANYKVVASAEEHFTVGGICSILADALSTLETHPKLLRFGVRGNVQIAGNYKYMMEKYGLTANMIADKIAEEFQAR